MVELQRAAQTLPAGHATVESAGSVVGDDEPAVQPLMVAFAAIMLDMVSDGAAQVILAERHDAIETLRLDRQHESLRVGIQVRRPCRKGHHGYAAVLQHSAELGCVQRVPVEDRIPEEQADDFPKRVTSGLPGLPRPGCPAGIVGLGACPAWPAAACQSTVTKRRQCGGAMAKFAHRRPAANAAGGAFRPSGGFGRPARAGPRSRRFSSGSRTLLALVAISGQVGGCPWTGTQQAASQGGDAASHANVPFGGDAASSMDIPSGLDTASGVDVGPDADIAPDPDVPAGLDADPDVGVPPRIDVGQPCAVHCAGKACGDDGCGGSCGTCGEPASCQDGTCVPGPELEPTTCDEAHGFVGCCANDGVYWFEGGSVQGEKGSCSGQPCGWDPDNGRYACGHEGEDPSGTYPTACGGVNPAPESCLTCGCGSKQCGHDGCGTSCGSCGAGVTCDGMGQCAGAVVPACIPQCTGKRCGPDGCGGTCGTCPGWKPKPCGANGQCQVPLVAGCTDGWCLIPPGSFLMGSSMSESCNQPDEHPAHTVTLTRAFLLKQTEVTQAEWHALVGNNPGGLTGCADCPVEMVSWFEAVAYCNLLSAAEGLSECYTLSGCDGAPGEGMGCLHADFAGLDCTGYRLPTEAEWEYAARAGDSVEYHLDPGDNYGCSGYLWDPTPYWMQPVGLFGPNPWGLFDTFGSQAGNAAEWVWDWYGDLYYEVSPGKDPLGPTAGSSRAVRGWVRVTTIVPMAYRAATRGAEDPDDRDVRLSFRPARTVPCTPQCGGKSCGPDGCGGTCGMCAAGDEVCGASGQCMATLCAPKCEGKSCGPDGCGGTCGTCESGMACGTDGQCHALAADCSDDWCVIAAGSFFMGSPEDEPCRSANESPVHQVELTRAFLMKQTEVTHAEWQALVGEWAPTFSGCLDCPVTGVNRDEALTYCNLLSVAEGLPACYSDGCYESPLWGTECGATHLGGLDCPGYRLPTEAEWEYAARAGTSTAFYVGPKDPTACGGSDANLDAIAWHGATSGGEAHGVGLLAPNAWGLHDMAGNASELVGDWYEADYYATSPPADPLGPGWGYQAVFRGGSWTHPFGSCRAAARFDVFEGYSFSYVGFRPVRSIPCTQCEGKSCGPDGCGGTCGTCAAGETCSASGQCVLGPCSPRCAGKSCGPDGCGGSCATCAGGKTCGADGLCEAPPAAGCADGWCLIPAGSFLMGSADDEPCRSDDEGPAHNVVLTRTFLMKQAEVTQAEWQTLVWPWKNPAEFSECPDCPIETVNWFEAASYCNLLSQADGLPLCYDLGGCTGSLGQDLECTDVGFAGPDCAGYRLPTEAEWEYAARAGTSGAYYSGPNDPNACSGKDANLDPIAWYDDAAGGETHPVALLAPNAWGLHDMAGNVGEWVWDRYDAGYYAESLALTPLGPVAGSRRVARGGSWGDAARLARAAARSAYWPGDGSAHIGFRPVRSVACIPTCGNMACGPDGCDGGCGTCAAGTSCNASGQCVGALCLPTCAAKTCGPDGCGGT